MNQFSSGRILVFALTALFVVAACDGSKRPVPYSQVEIGDPPENPGVPPQNNVNINNPTLTVATNDEVSPGDTLTLVWNDEFDGGALDPEVWFFETGDGSEYGIPGWGNNEQQFYLPDSAQLENGLLTITAREEQVETFRFTSARINTRDRFAFQYGRIEARMRLPGGQGLWPAFWLLPQDSPYGTWAASGEIDIMEAVNLGGSGGNTVYGTIHFGGESPANLSSGQSTLVATDATADFHTYAIEWDAAEIRWYVDDVLYHMENNWSSTAGAFPAPFDQPFHILFNVAVGGNWPGSPDASTVFPVTMEVDWVRVYSGEAPGSGGDEPAAAAPTPTADAANVISLFSDAYTDIAGIDYNPNWGQATVVTQVDIAGNNTLKYAGLNYQGTDFSGNAQDVSGMDTLHVDFWTADSTALNVSLISPGPAETAYALTVMPNTWVSVDIPLTEFAGVDLANVIQIKFDGNGTIFLDNLYFSIDAGPPTEPVAAAPTPTAAPADVISLFSDAYTDIAGIDYNPNWGQATVVTQVDIAGNNTLKYEGLNYQGTDFAGNAQDVSGMDTLHVDFWTADSTALNVSLISTGPVEMAYALTITPYTWVSVDIPLTAFAGVDLTDVIQLKFDGNGTIWLDNLYFRTAGGGAGGELAVNGGFESGDLSDWAQFPANAADPNEQTVVMTNPRSGAYAGRIHNTTPGTASIIKQANRMPVSIGQTATVSFSARGSFGVGGVAFAEFFTELAGEGTSSARILGGGPLGLNADANVWTDFSFDIDITADVSGGITLQLTSTTGGDAASFADVYYDDISIVVTD
jgi:beta-glucanase (GH16 family)